MPCESSDIQQPFVLKTMDCFFAPLFEAALSWEIVPDFKQAAEENRSFFLSSDKSGVESCQQKEFAICPPRTCLQKGCKQDVENCGKHEDHGGT
jgi:hypothetical protein